MRDCSNVEVRDVRIADKDGVWLTVDRAKLVWSRTALFSRRLEVDQLEIDRLSIARRPVAEETDKAQAAEAPQLPALPVKLIVGGPPPVHVTVMLVTFVLMTPLPFATVQICAGASG